MSHTVLRKCLVLIGIVSTLLVLATVHAVSAQEVRFDGITLRVATYGGSYRDALHDLIGRELERRGGKIEYVIGNPRDNLAKLIAARGRDVPFDLMEVDGTVKFEMLEANLLEELNFANLPNVEDLVDPTYRDKYTLVVWLSQDGIIYNVKKFQELGIPKPEIKDLFNPKLAGRVAFPDINHTESTSGIVAFAYERGGNESNIEPGLALIKELKVAMFVQSATELHTKFTSGDVWAAWFHAGSAVRLRRAGVPVGISYPKVGKDKRGAVTPGLIGIPKGGKARQAAEFYLNRYFDSEVMAKLHRRIGVAPVKVSALPPFLNDPEVNELMLLTPTQIQQLYQVDWSKVNMREWVPKWNRIVAQ